MAAIQGSSAAPLMIGLMYQRNFTYVCGAAIAASVLLPLFVFMSSREILALRSGDEMAILTPGLLGGVAGVLFLFAAVALFWWTRDLTGKVSEIFDDQGAYIDAIKTRWVAPGLLVAAAVSLFLEMAMIRWQMSGLPLLTYYKNFSLMACFAGLGLGYALASAFRAIPLLVVPFMLLWQFALLLFLRYGMGEIHGFSLSATPVFEEIQTNLVSTRTHLHYVTVMWALGTVFLLTSLTFIPLGQLCGRLMARMQNLRAYGFNLAGSVIGVVLMLVLSFFWTPPAVWFALGLGALFPFYAYSSRALGVGAAATLAALSVLLVSQPAGVRVIHSPYQPLEIRFSERGLASVYVGDRFYQQVFDLSAAGLSESGDSHLAMTARFYQLPYRFAPLHDTVLIVGAGTGNDVAAALREGSGSVTAVEIDPAILDIGRAAHPEHPYADARVRTVVDDARSYMRNEEEKYDLIVYGLLDSQAILSHMALVRMDSFVYTLEGFREARAILNETGIISLSFAHLSAELGEKIHRMLTEAFDGQPPLWLDTAHGYVFLQANSPDTQTALEALAVGSFERLVPKPEAALSLTLSTDDWPFFYMPRRVFPVSFLPMMIIMILGTVALVFVLLPGRPQSDQGLYFLLGAAFMLVQTKGITELGLMFGNTWQVIGFLIIGLLSMAYVANLLVARSRIQRLTWPFALLFLSLATGYFIAIRGGYQSTWEGRAAALGILTLPVFFSGIIFSTVIRRATSMGSVMAANIIGAMVGGMLEYNSMRFGFKSLYILIFAIYLLAAVYSVALKRWNAGYT